MQSVPITTYVCKFESHSWRGVLDTTLCDKVCQLLAAGQWFYRGTRVFTNWPPQYNWNIDENGIKHHNPNPSVPVYFIVKFLPNNYCKTSLLVYWPTCSPQVWYIMGFMPWLLKCGISWVWCLDSSSVVYHGFDALAPQVWYIMGLMPWLLKCGISWVWCLGSSSVVYHGFNALAPQVWYIMDLIGSNQRL
jgi:hypothetical protein